MIQNFDFALDLHADLCWLRQCQLLEAGDRYREVQRQLVQVELQSEVDLEAREAETRGKLEETIKKITNQRDTANAAAEVINNIFRSLVACHLNERRRRSNSTRVDVTRPEVTHCVAWRFFHIMDCFPFIDKIAMCRVLPIILQFCYPLVIAKHSHADYCSAAQCVWQ